MVVNRADQKPKPSETHNSTFPQDSDCDSESDIELRSTHTSPETTTSDKLDGTLVDTSLSTTPTPSLSGEGDLDCTEGHSASIGGTLPLTDQGLPDSVSTEGDPQEKHPPPCPSKAEGPTSTDTPPRNTSDSPPDLGDNSEKRIQNLVKAREETVTTPPLKELEHTVSTPPSDNTYTEGTSKEPSVPKEPTLHKEESPSEYPFNDHPEVPLGAENGLVIPPVYRTYWAPLS